jgi:predicted transcriptional regulator
MLELTRKPHTEGMVSLTVVVPSGRADAVAMAIKEALEPNVPADRVFPDSTPGKVLRGARGLKEMTQAQLAKSTGVRPAHISDMENGRRPIGKEMARKLGLALDFPYKAFL